jgi:hypothetical protein
MLLFGEDVVEPGRVSCRSAATFPAYFGALEFAADRFTWFQVFEEG